LNCNFEMNTYKACKMAVYKNDFSQTSTNALVNIQKIALLFGFITLFLSFYGFVSYPYKKDKDGSKSKD